MFINKFLHLRPSISLTFPFTTLHPQPLQDWQYVSEIQHHLKLNQVNHALTLIINVPLPPLRATSTNKYSTYKFTTTCTKK